MSMRPEPTDTKPWYRQSMFWLVVSIPAASVVLGLTLLTISVSVDEGTIVDDYYKQGLAINQSIERDRRAEELGVKGRYGFDFDAGRLSLSLSSDDPVALQAPMRLRLLHATKSGLDQELLLTRTGPGQYAAVFGPLVLGRWYLYLETEDWRRTASARLPETTEVLFPTP